VTEESLPDVRPRKLLLATDLSSRGDRAFDRAVHLAREWNAELHVMHAVEAGPAPVPAGVDAEAYLRRHPDREAEALRRLEELVAHSGAHAGIHVEHAAPAHAILAVAEREACDLIVLGEGRERLVGPLESTIEHVVRRSPASVLAVRARPRGAYARLLVGTDFTDEARQALLIVARLFPSASITVMHAYSMPYAGMLDTADDAWAGDLRARLRAHLDEAGLSPARKASVRTRIEAGPPAAVMMHYMQAEGADLTVIGAHPRGMLFDAVVGSSRSIVDAIPGDIMVVRATRRDNG
jgi:nucleotide-binding universal stress UspA family protein